MKPVTRCPWGDSNELMREYHDTEWGVPTTDDRLQFEHLCLEVFQAGLSWLIVLRKRENFRKAFRNFVPAEVARMTKSDVERLLKDEGIIRNKAKIEAVIHNAPLFLDICEEYNGFFNFLELFKPKKSRTHKKQVEIPAKTPEAEQMAKDLKKRGFKFLGPTTIYAHMQSVGLVNDHIKSCFRFKEVNQ